MTRKLSLTSAVAVTALVFAAPAFGIIPRSDGSGGSEGGLHPAIAAQLGLDSNVATYERGSGLTKLGEVAASSTAVTNYKDAFERLVAARQSSRLPLLGRSDSADGAIAAGKRSEAGPLTVPDAFERAVANRGNQSTVLRHSDSADGAAFTGRADAPVVSATSSGGEIEWSQVGVGLGIGILLALGLGLIMRVVHIRPFAH